MYSRDYRRMPEILREVSPAHRELLEHGRKKNIFFLISFDSLKKTKVMKNFLDFLDLVWWSYKVNNKKGVWEIAKKHVFQYFSSILPVTPSFFNRLFWATSHSKDLIKLNKKVCYEATKKWSLCRKKMSLLQNSAFFRRSFFHCKSFFEVTEVE